MRVIVLAALAMPVAATAAVAGLLGNDIARNVCVTNAPGYTMSAAEAAAYDSGNTVGGFSYGGSTSYQFVHLAGSGEAQCKEQVSEGMFINQCRTSPVSRSGNTLSNTGAWTDWGACA
ncbi:MAG: hypothetical protein IT561_27940 [Alphaproteobacteria bacterium]|nr:hypothetical protein [Alphaproteobacteria bacterium]